MNPVILSGPALAVTKSDAKYLALFDTELRKTMCNVMLAPNTSKNLQLTLNNNLSDIEVFKSVLVFLQAVGRQFNKAPIVLTDSDALVFSMALSAGYVSSNIDVTNLLATMDFVVEAGVTLPGETGQVNKIRLHGLSIKGIKQLAKASDLTLTITLK